MQPRILVVDDDDSSNRTLRRFFEFRGFRVDRAGELEEAEALLSNYAYEIVISDLRVTQAHGSEGLRILSYVHEHCPSTRMVMLAGAGHAEIEAEARSRGVDILERAPASLPVLARDINRLLVMAS
ncbi:MAG: response regulator [Thermoanaerobaculia bacterium]